MMISETGSKTVATVTAENAHDRYRMHFLNDLSMINVSVCIRSLFNYIFHKYMILLVLQFFFPRSCVYVFIWIEIVNITNINKLKSK